MASTALSWCGQRLREQRSVGKAHQHRDAMQRRRILRHAMRLRVVDHLQAMLELAQKMIGDGQGRRVLRR